jgi:hypothetical protein
MSYFCASRCQKNNSTEASGNPATAVMLEHGGYFSTGALRCKRQIVLCGGQQEPGWKRQGATDESIAPR